MWQVVDLGGAGHRLRERAEINDVAAVRSPDGRLYVLLERQGLVYGPWARDLVLDEVDEDHANVSVVVVGTVPRCARTGALDDAACIAIGEQAAENPGRVFSLDPPATEEERVLSELIVELLPIRRLSMTDSLPMVGADSPRPGGAECGADRAVRCFSERDDTLRGGQRPRVGGGRLRWRVEQAR
ncbi:hypothetical protein GCM10029963_00290 [Micromonospora andamanensis]